MRRKPRHHTGTRQSLPDIARLWLLRILSSLNKQQWKALIYNELHIACADALVFRGWECEELDESQRKTFIGLVKEAHSKAEAKHSSTVPPYILGGNVARLANLAGLSDIDARILEFLCIFHGSKLLREIAEFRGDVSIEDSMNMISEFLHVPRIDIKTSLNPRGSLATTGLVTKEKHSYRGQNFIEVYELLNDYFADLMLNVEIEPFDLIKDTVQPSGPVHLALSDFGHINKTLEILLPLMKHVSATGKKGVNIFIYGAPGTGKTQLAKAMAREIAVEMYEISSCDADNDPLNGKERLKAYRAAQSFIQAKRAILLFDESEDVFNDGNDLYGSKSTGQLRKGWINQTLETNRLPTIWISNNARCLDPAFTRRFDMVIELPTPPKWKREEIIQKACKGKLNGDMINDMSESEDLSPGVVTRAISVVQSIETKLDSGSAQNAVEHLVNSTLMAQGHRAITNSSLNQLPSYYDLDFINASGSLKEIEEGLANSKSGRLCLYGPSGTGKSAFAKWIAKKLDRHLLTKKGSDLISMWVGGSEKNIASAFAEAAQTDAILLVDEVDGFLQDRRKAQRSWEVSGVNEMLTQIESFSGIFVASTNLMDDIDPAALRRFDIKVKFDYMLPVQCWSLFQHMLKSLSIAIPNSGIEKRLATMRYLTLGDFASVARRHRFSKFNSAADVLQALEEEVSFKKVGAARMGLI